MSVRAYRRITQPTTADSPTFNLWHNQTLVDRLLELEGSWDGITDGGGGTIEFNVEELEKFVKSEEFAKAFEPEDTPEEIEASRQAFLADIEAAKPEEYISYECY